MTKNILIKISIGISRFLFALGCIFMAVFMCHKQYIHYRSNQDSSSVANRRFEDSNEDIYPTFSICYHGEHGQIFKSYYIDYLAKCLSSCNDESYKTNNTLECVDKCKGDEYFEKLIGIEIDDKNATLSSQRSEYVEKIVNIASTILKFESVTTDGKIIRHLENGDQNLDSFDLAFAMTYQDPWNLCFTKRQKPNQYGLLRYDYLELKDGVSYKNYAKYSYRIYVHQKGQLLRRLGGSRASWEKKLSKIENQEYQLSKRLNKTVELNRKFNGLREKLMGYRYEINIRVNSVDVLRKRPDAILPCNNKLYDEYVQWIKRVTEVLGCIPPFFDGNKLEATTSESLACQKTQYEDYSINYRPENYFYRIARFYKQPCVEMTPTVISSKDKVWNEEKTSNIEEYNSREKRNVNEKSKEGKSGSNKKRPKTDKKMKNANDNEFSGSDYISQFPCLNDSFEEPNCLRKVNIKIEYITDGYKETINRRSFTILSLLSQIGGFIGMFLGYSLLHLPQLAGFAATIVQNIATKDNKKDSKVLWNSIKQKKVLPKMNYVNSRGVLDRNVNHLN